MAILFAGSELGDFSFVQGSGAISEAGAIYSDSTYTRSSVEMSGTSQLGCTVPPSPEIWISGQVYKQDGPSRSECTFMEVESAIGPVLRVKPTNTYYELELQRWDGTAWVVVQTVSQGYQEYSLDRHVFHVVIGPSGVLEWYREGVLKASYYGDTSAFGDVTSVKIGPIDTGRNDATNWSEVIVATHDVSSARLKTMNITSAGDQTDWAGTYADIEAYDSPDTTFISSGTAGQESTFQVDGLAADTMDVAAVVVSGRFRKGASGPSGIDAVVRTGLANYTQSLGSLGTGFSLKQAIWVANPATSALWEKSEVEALQVGVESVA